MQQTIVLRKRSTVRNKNHNLFKNGHFWWCHLTVWEGPTQGRLRFSLKTKDVKKARAMRDKIIKDAEDHFALIWC
jgi:hypothetical protein